MAAVTGKPDEHPQAIAHGCQGWDVTHNDPAQATPEEGMALAEALTLMRDHPRWAIWLPADGEDWTAIRPASSRPPAPELPTIWIHAASATELAQLMQAADEQVSGRGRPDRDSPRSGHREPRA
jgi:hypothetical protein